MQDLGRSADGWGGVICVVTGGLGFVGTNLVRRLLALGGTVRVVDALIPEHGGRADHADDLELDAVLVASIADPAVAELVDGCDVVFNFAGQVSHTASMRAPRDDLEYNTISHAGFLETLRRVCPAARVVHASTRQVYGRSTRSTVDELHPANPVDVNGVAKLAGEQLHLVYAHAYDMAITSLRLTNVYGPRQRLTSDELGFLPVFFRRALSGETIELFGDGTQRRDCLHVADVVEAALAATDDRAVGETFNVGHPVTHSLAEIATMIAEAGGGPSALRLVPWPTERARIDIGSFHTASHRMANVLGWRAAIDLAGGVAETVRFYREHPWYLSLT